MSYFKQISYPSASDAPLTKQSKFSIFVMALGHMEWE